MAPRLLGKALVAGSGAPKILLVDDDPNALAALAELLREAGYEVATAHSDFEATMALASFEPQVVLTEVRGPWASWLYPEWAGGEAEAGPYQVLMSAAQPPRGHSAPWLKKPVDLEELLALLGRLTGERG